MVDDGGGGGEVVVDGEREIAPPMIQDNGGDRGLDSVSPGGIDSLKGVADSPTITGIEFQPVRQFSTFQMQQKNKKKTLVPKVIVEDGFERYDDREEPVARQLSSTDRESRV